MEEKKPTPHSNAKGKRKANILPLPQKNVHEKTEIGKQKSGTLNSSKQNGFNTPRPSFQKVGNNIGRTMPDFSIPPPSTVRNFNTPTTQITARKVNKWSFKISKPLQKLTSLNF